MQKVLKAKPKIYIADSVVRNAVLMIDNLFTDSLLKSNQGGINKLKTINFAKFTQDKGGRFI